MNTQALARTFAPAPVGSRGCSAMNCAVRWARFGPVSARSNRQSVQANPGSAAHAVPDPDSLTQNLAEPGFFGQRHSPGGVAFRFGPADMVRIAFQARGHITNTRTPKADAENRWLNSSQIFRSSGGLIWPWQ